MGLSDFLPFEFLSKFFNIHTMLTISIIYFSGYLTLKLMEKYSLVNKNLHGFDHVFIISISGFIWFIRINLFYLLSTNFQNIVNDLSIPINIKEYVQPYCFLFSILLGFSIVFDISFLMNKFPFRYYSEIKRKHQLIKKLTILWNKNNLTIVTIHLFIFSLPLTYGSLMMIEEYPKYALPFFVFMTISLIPSIGWLFKFVKKLC